jgi:hypothetical protein
MLYVYAQYNTTKGAMAVLYADDYNDDEELWLWSAMTRESKSLWFSYTTDHSFDDDFENAHAS